MHETRKMRMEDIARLAGVSTATVSGALHGSHVADRKTAERIQALLHNSRFIPDSLTRGLKSELTNIHGLLIMDITNPFFPEIVKEFDSLAIAGHCGLILSNADVHRNTMDDSVRCLVTWKVHGVAILTSNPDRQSLQDLNVNSMPFVTLDRRMVGRGQSDVAVDSTPGIIHEMKYSNNFRHGKIGFIGGLPGEAISKHRYDDFVEALKNQ